MWSEVAQSLSGSLDINSHLGASELELRATVDGIAVVVTGNSVPYRPLPAGDIAIVAEAPGAGELEFDFHRRGLRASLARLVGIDTNTMRVVSASDLPYAQAWVEGAHTERLKYTCEGYEFTLADGIARADRGSFDTSGPRVLRAIRAVSSLANGAARLEQRWASLAERLGASGHTASWPDGMTMTCAHGGMPIHLRATVSPQLFACARAERRGRATDAYVIYDPTAERPKRPRDVARRPIRIGRTQFRAWASEPDRLRHRLIPRSANLLEQVRPQRIAADARTVEVFLRGFVTDAARVQAAAALAYALASDDTAGLHNAPYR